MSRKPAVSGLITCLTRLLETVHIARITAVEVVSALTRRHRKGDIDKDSFDELVARFQLDFRTQYKVVEISPALIDEAMRLAKGHGLRGYDPLDVLAIERLLDMRHRGLCIRLGP